MEQVAAAAATGLTEGTLDTLLEQHAQTLGTEQPCPDCGRLCAVDFEDRPLAVHGGQLTLHEPVSHCPDCRRDFFPCGPRVRLDNHGYSPTLLQRITEAAARLPSFADAAFALHLAGVEISSRHVQRIAAEMARN